MQDKYLKNTQLNQQKKKQTKQIKNKKYYRPGHLVVLVGNGLWNMRSRTARTCAHTKNAHNQPFTYAYGYALWLPPMVHYSRTIMVTPYGYAPPHYDHWLKQNVGIG